MDTTHLSVSDKSAPLVPPLGAAALSFQGLPTDIPALNELREHHRWIVWKLVWRPGKPKPDKVPYSVHTGSPADTTNPAMWATCDEAEAFAIRRGMSGVGFCLGEGCEFAAYDFDGCHDPKTGEFAPWVLDVLDLGETYGEFSPSNTGLRFFTRSIPERTETFKPAGIEVYRNLRFLTVTGNHVDGTPRDIRWSPRTEKLLLDRIKAARAKSDAEKAEGDRQRASVRASAHAQARRPADFGPDDGADADAALGDLPNDYDDHADWIKIGMSTYAAGASFPAFDNWSRKHPSYDPGRTRKAWESFERGGVRNVTAATLFAFVRQRVPGWRKPSQQSQSVGTKRTPAGAAKSEQTIGERDQAPSGGEMQLNSHALKNLDRWIPDLFPHAVRQGEGSYTIEADKNGEELEDPIIVGVSGSTLPIDLWAEQRGMARGEASRELARMLGFNLLDEMSAEQKAKHKAEQAAERQAEKAAKLAEREAKRQAKQERAARLADAIRDTSGRAVVRYHARAFSEAAEASEKAIAKRHTHVLVRGGDIVRPVISDAEGVDGKRTKVVELMRVDLPYMRQLMDTSVAYEAPGPENGPDWVPAKPPKEVAELILSRAGHWPFLNVVGVIACPTLRPDGSLLSAEGYDPQTRLFLMSDVVLPPIPNKPTRADAQTSLARLNGLLSEFPFVGQGSKSVALSALTSSVNRGMMPRAPVHAVTAPMAGTGKTLLLDLASILATGFACAVQSVGRKDEETEKRLVGSILAGAPIICLDNINGTFGSDFLCQIATQPRVEVRPLGGSGKVTIEPRAMIFANGNNMALTGDLIRRTIVARLDTQLEDPHKRQFKSNPAATIMADRGRYVADCLTVVLAYMAAGQPGRLPRLASFEDWSDHIRSSLVWLGCDDPCETMDRARDEDPEAAKAVAFFEAWDRELGTEGEHKASDIIHAIEPHSDGPNCPLLREAVTAIAARRGVVDAAALGTWMSRHRDRVISGLQLVQGQLTGGSRRWLMRRAGRGA